ncbi:MAG: hypothetical protein VX684_04945, partial [Planctomycetota bacterium]|nr:hypothetical protein [Planctomycetota bacterium]
MALKGSARCRKLVENLPKYFAGILRKSIPKKDPIRMVSDSPSIDLSEVSKTYRGRVHALRSVSLQVH